MNRRNASYMYMEYLRVICAFMVIMIHVSGANWFKIEIGSANWIIQTFFNLFGRFSVCVFCMISGALLLRPDKTICIHDIFHKYIKRILICFVTWLILYQSGKSTTPDRLDQTWMNCLNLFDAEYNV